VTNSQKTDSSLRLPPHFEPATGAFIMWIYNQVLHHPGGALRQATWDAQSVAPLRAQGGLVYGWEAAGDGTSQLGLRTPQGAGTLTVVTTESEHPPFITLMQAWYDLAFKIKMIDMEEYLDAVAALHQRPKQGETDEYGETSRTV
jgi:hypothetical protein